VIQQSNIVITGASSGIGKAILEMLAKPENDNRIVAASPAIAASAAGMLLNAVRDASLTHVADQVLRDSVLETQKRKIGEGFGFDGQCAERIDSCALAVYGIKTTKRNPVKKGRVGC
jgi:NAD(P)-dependent dehydrogenase (short-subunit alcohol dehydrogenase family)